MNSDEIGLGGSTSQRMKNVYVIVSNNHKAGVSVNDLQLISHISSPVKITAAFTKFLRCSIIIRESEHPGRIKCPYYDKTPVYSTSAAFIDRNIFEATFSEVVFSDITRIQSKLRSNTESTLNLYNRLEDHITQHIFS